MFTDHTLVTINVTCIIFLVLMMAVLIAATRMKGGAGWAALVIVSTTVPVYLSNLMRELGSDYFLASLYPAVFLNVLCMPALWLLTRSQLDKSFRFTWKSWFHMVPAIVSLAAHIIYYSPLSTEQIEAERNFLESGNENLPAIINDIILFGQFFIYFTAIFIYIHKRKKFLQDHFSDSDFLTIKWIPAFMFIFFLLFFIVFVAYVINPRTDAWLIPILNTIGMAYLVYNFVFHSTQSYISRIPTEKSEVEKSSTAQQKMSEKEMKEISEKVVNYLTTTKAYTNPDFSLSMLSVETGISPKNISRSINGYLGKNFFDLINEMRIEEAKKKITSLGGNYTIDSMSKECGFRSRSTFFAAFKKAEGKTPAQWMKTEG